MSTRSRRANAGNRMSLLLAEQTPLNDEESALFAERDDDEDFDLEAEEERLRQMAAAASSDGEERDEAEGSGEDESGEESEHDDSNFSDSTDDSELENDVEPADAGEKELQKEQRTLSREKRIAERNKMFTIKRRDPKPESSSSEPKKKRVFTSADLLLKGRHSSRKSALRNKQHLIEQMREVEERRARYVPPKKKKLPKLTQEQRLEETKKTEAKNLASLNKFVELEEERKLQQRLAMISKRPRLTQFVRFHSAQYLAPPKLVEVVGDKAEDDGDGLTIKPESIHNVPQMSQVSSSTSGQSRPSHDGGLLQTKPDVVDNKSAEADEFKEGNVQGSESSAGSVADGNIVKTQEVGENSRPDEHGGSAAKDETMGAHSIITDGASAKRDHEQGPEDAAFGLTPTGDRKLATDLETRSDTAAVKPEPSMQVKYEDNLDEEPKLDLVSANDVNPVHGPAQLKTYDFLTLHEFPDGSMNKYAVRSIVLGRIASMPTHMPAKRMCPFSGLPARYLDPATGVAYYNLGTNKMLKLVSNNELGWSKELGGVFTSSLGKQRHAKGVPEGFA